MSGKKAKELNLKPLAVIRGFGDAAHDPKDFPTAPAKAVPRALQMAGLTLNDIALHEVNEAFAVVVLANQKVFYFILFVFFFFFFFLIFFLFFFKNN